MRSWDTLALDLRPHAPEIISTSGETRAIAIEIPAGEALSDHQVHERAWVTVLAGEVEITSADGGSASGGAGLVAEFDPRERHAIHARTTARILLLLTPWPGDGHPGALTSEARAQVRQRAAEHQSTS